MLLIAPESDGILLSLVDRLSESGVHWIGPSVELARLAGDKAAIAAMFGCVPPTAIWSERGPRWGLEEPARFEVKAEQCYVLKPRRGAGAQFTGVVLGRDFTIVAETFRKEGFRDDLIVQPFIEGTPVSIAVCRSESGRLTWLPMCEQAISFDEEACAPTTWNQCEPRKQSPPAIFERLSYAGGRLPRSDAATSQAREAVVRRVVEQVIERLPPWTGYLGFDLVIEDGNWSAERTLRGETPGVWLVDINARLTTSYLGYRQRLGPIVSDLVIGLDADLPPDRASADIDYGPGDNGK